MKQNNKESKALYSFCPLLTADGDVRAGFLIDKTDLAKVSDRQAAILESVFACAASSAAVKTITLSAQDPVHGTARNLLTAPSFFEEHDDV